MKRPPENILLKPLYEELSRIASNFQEINFQHIYRERNITTNQIPKIDLQVGDGIWNQWELSIDTISEHDPRPHQDEPNLRKKKGSKK